MFSTKPIVITCENIQGFEDVAIKASHQDFYLQIYKEIKDILVEEESIVCLPLSQKFEEKFQTSPPYVVTTGSNDEENREIFIASNYGMVIYRNMDFSQADIRIDTQSLYFCTKIVIISGNLVIDIHLPIDNFILESLTSSDLQKLFNLLQEFGVDFKSSRWFSISGNLREKTDLFWQQSDNVSKDFVAKFLTSLLDFVDFPPEHLQQIDMMVRQNFKVNFQDMTLSPYMLPVETLSTTKENGEYESSSSSSEDEANYLSIKRNLSDTVILNVTGGSKTSDSEPHQNKGNIVTATSQQDNVPPLHKKCKF